MTRAPAPEPIGTFAGLVALGALTSGVPILAGVPSRCKGV
jgi:hypothetical protein